MATRESARGKEADRRRVLDEASRRRRARKALEALQQDNYHEDPHADLVMSKKLPKFADSNEKPTRKRKQRGAEYYKMRFRKNFVQLCEEDAAARPDPPNYSSAHAPPSNTNDPRARRLRVTIGLPCTGDDVGSIGIEFKTKRDRYRVIGHEITRVKYVSLIIDSTPDIAHVDQLTLVIRYVLESGEPCEGFLKFLPSVGHKAEEMFSVIISELETLGINIEDCHGQSYDNAANMSSMYNGLQAKIRNQAPFAFYVPCSAHSLNLVATADAVSCTEACRFFIMLQEIYVIFLFPERHLCAVCGFPAPYTCVACGARHCGLRCLGTHLDTRCLKWTA
ncbi:Zinc finger HIT domain-containing protein 1 [Eumeta japonica]|uniref:Zinc finger HIT domain-containing protein 1 n=1 Tax=Eumeta variegata TaxID=151549 RepID=A0A4C1W074_EUMVA|nr:Zinc finger HIT domain-containing protein 1 [Eumeta japonica]